MSSQFYSEWRAIVFNGKRLLRIRAELLHPLAQHVLVDAQIACRLPNGNARTSLTASTLNSRVNRRLSIACLLLH